MITGTSLLRQVYSHLPNIAHMAGIVVTNPTRLASLRLLLSEDFDWDAPEEDD